MFEATLNSAPFKKCTTLSCKKSYARGDDGRRALLRAPYTHAVSEITALLVVGSREALVVQGAPRLKIAALRPKCRNCGYLWAFFVRLVMVTRAHNFLASSRALNVN